MTLSVGVPETTLVVCLEDNDGSCRGTLPGVALRTDQQSPSGGIIGTNELILDIPHHMTKRQ